MSYYFKYDFSFSDHGLQRAKERLNLKDKQEWEIRKISFELINKSTRNFESDYELYIEIPKTNLYFVINKSSKTIITVTKISPEKQLTFY